MSGRRAIGHQLWSPQLLHFTPIISVRFLLQRLTVALIARDSDEVCRLPFRHHGLRLVSEYKNIFVDAFKLIINL